MGAEINPADLSPDAASPADPKNIHRAILEVRKQVSYIQKKKPDGLNYTIAAIDDMIRECRPLMNYYGVMIYPESQAVASEQTFKTSKGSEMREVVVACTWKLVHADSGSELLIQTIGQAADTGDKAVPKGTTAAYKEAIKRIFVIESGNMDPDSYASTVRQVTDTGVKTASFAPAKTALSNAKNEQDLTRLWGFVEKKGFPKAERDELWEVHNEVQGKLRETQPPVRSSAPPAVSNGSARRQPAASR